jgi:hypothetical protein
VAGLTVIQECDESSACRNSIAALGWGSGKCGICKLSPTSEGIGQNYWSSSVPGKKHSGLVAAQKANKLTKHLAAQVKKRSVDKGKQVILTRAAQAEKTTERNLIHATKNSGRSNKDGDHVAMGEITLDTKLQTTRENPVVLLHEIIKVNGDSKRAGTMFGALVLRNKHGIGVVAMAEADFARLIQRLQ